MTKKRKSLATSLDEVDRTMYSSFCSAANSLSQLYTQAMNQQKLSFQAGEHHGLEKLYQWILRQQEGGSRVTTADILSYLQNELDYHGEEPSLSPRVQLQNQHSQTQMSLPNSGFLISSGSSATQDQQLKNYVFSNALSSQGRRSLQNYHIMQESYSQNIAQPVPSGFRDNAFNLVQHQNNSSIHVNSNESFMDMHADSPDHQST